MRHTFVQTRITTLLLYFSLIKDFDKTDLVIEAVFEDLDLKHKVLKDVEQVELLWYREGLY